MKNLSKKILLFGLLVIVGIFILTNLNKTSMKNSLEFKNMLLIGWDGTQRDVLYQLLDDRKLPSLASVIKEGGLFDIDILSGETETKPGWAEILTGYFSQSLDVYSNQNYKPISKGYAIFERLEDYFGKENIITVFIGGKFNHIGAKGPHKVCINCSVRDPKTFERFNLWDESTHYITKTGEQRIFENREGEPYYHTKDSLDFYLVGLKEAPNVGKKALELLEQYKNQRFFMFIHFEEPDEIGHRYGGNSEEYKHVLVINDQWLEKIITFLKKRNIYGQTLIYVTSDHGFNQNAKHHKSAPDTFLATNDQRVKRSGTRLDIAPTILKRYGFDLQKISPRLDGKPLLGID